MIFRFYLPLYTLLHFSNTDSATQLEIKTLTLHKHTVETIQTLSDRDSFDFKLIAANYFNNPNTSNLIELSTLDLTVVPDCIEESLQSYYESKQQSQRGSRRSLNRKISF
jgi:hypothetical protein